MKKSEMFRAMFPEADFPFDLLSFYHFTLEEGVGRENSGLCISRKGTLCLKRFEVGDSHKISVAEMLGAAAQKFDLPEEISPLYHEQKEYFSCLQSITLQPWLQSNVLHWVLITAETKTYTRKGPVVLRVH